MCITCYVLTIAFAEMVEMSTSRIILHPPFHHMAPNHHLAKLRDLTLLPFKTPRFA